MVDYLSRPTASALPSATVGAHHVVLPIFARVLTLQQQDEEGHESSPCTPQPRHERSFPFFFFLAALQLGARRVPFVVARRAEKAHFEQTNQPGAIAYLQMNKRL